MSTHTKSRIFDKLERQLNPMLWSELLNKDADTIVLWRIDEKWRLVAATLWMEEDNFKKLGNSPSAGDLARLVVNWQRSKDLTTDPKMDKLSTKI